MEMFMRNAVVLIVLVGLVSPAVASAQTQAIATSFDQLRVLVRPGNTVTVTDAAGNETRGKVLAVSGASLELSVDGTPRSWAESQVRVVSQQRHSFGAGARRGFFIGAVIGGVGGGAVAGGFGASAGETVGFALMSAGAYGALGAGIGVVVSALHRGSHVVYAGRPTSPISVAPVVLNHRKGVALSLRF